MQPILAETALELTILRTQGRERAFLVTLVGNGPSRAGHLVSAPSWQAVHLLVDGFRQLFKAVPAGAGEDALSTPSRSGRVQSLLLHSVGVELFHLWLAPFWSAIEAGLRGRPPLVLTVVSDVPEILNLPWELLHCPDGPLLGLDERVALRRRPVGGWSDGGSDAAGESLDPGCLRVLLLSSAPGGFQGEAENSFARFLLPAAEEQPPIAFSVVQRATRAEWHRSLERVRPHLVYLTGPALISGERGFFGFEDEQGQADPRSADELAEALCADGDLLLVVVAGRERGRPPPVAAVGALCQGLVGHGVARALAWPGLLTDPLSGAFFQALLHTMRMGATIDQAICRARCAVQPDCERAGYPAWVLSALYARS